MGLHTYRATILDFTEAILAKVELRKDKHTHDDLIPRDLKEHLIEEIVELFQIPTSQQELIWSILGGAELDSEELVDVAALCWGLWLVK